MPLLAALLAMSLSAPQPDGSNGTPAKLSPEQDQQIQAVIDRVEAQCKKRTIYMVGRKKAQRLAELVRQARPAFVVECGTAIGYSGLWIARELQRAGRGKLLTFEIRPENAREATANFAAAGLAAVVTVQVGDARKLAGTVKEPVYFLFLDCNAPNYYPCFLAIEKQLHPGTVVVADNAGISAGGMEDYLKYVRGKHQSRIEWFDLDLPWTGRDAMEITLIK